jgi:hypothetical protein
MENTGHNTQYLTKRQMLNKLSFWMITKTKKWENAHMLKKKKKKKKSRHGKGLERKNFKILLATMNYVLLCYFIFKTTPFFFFFFFFCGTGVWTQALHLEPLYQPYFCEGFFEIGSPRTICPACFKPRSSWFPPPE